MSGKINGVQTKKLIDKSCESNRKTVTCINT